MDRYMQCLTATNAKCSNGGRVTFFNAKSSQTGQWIQAPHRVQEARSHTLALPLGSASRVWWSAGISLGCRSPDVGRGVSTKQYAELRQISKNHRKKETPLCLLALWNANRKLAEGSKSAAS